MRGLTEAVCAAAITRPTAVLSRCTSTMSPGSHSLKLGQRCPGQPAGTRGSRRSEVLPAAPMAGGRTTLSKHLGVQDAPQVGLDLAAQPLAFVQRANVDAGRAARQGVLEA